MRQQELDIEQHADGDEKKTGKNIAKRQYIAQCVMAVFGFADDQTRQKSPQGKRQADTGGQPGGRQADDNDGQQEQFAAAGACHLIEQDRHHIAGTEKYQHHHPQPFGRQQHQRIAQISGPPCQHGGNQHHGHDDNVLKDQNRQGGAAVGSIDFGTLLQQLEHNRGTAQSHQKTEKNGRASIRAEPDLDEVNDQQGHKNLQRAGDHDGLLDAQQVFEGKLYADGE